MVVDSCVLQLTVLLWPDGNMFFFLSILSKSRCSSCFSIFPHSDPVKSEFVSTQIWGFKKIFSFTLVQINVGLRNVHIRLGNQRYQAGLVSQGVTYNSSLKQPHIWWVFSKSHVPGNSIFIYALLIPCNDSYFGFETKQIVEK